MPAPLAWKSGPQFERGLEGADGVLYALQVTVRERYLLLSAHVVA